MRRSGLKSQSSVEMAQVGELKISSQDKWNVPLRGPEDQQTRPQLTEFILFIKAFVGKGTS